MTVGLGFCTATIHDISYDSLFTAKVFTALKLWLARRVKESACKVTDRGSHMERALTRSVGKVEGDNGGKEGEVAFVGEGRGVGRVAVVRGVRRRNIRGGGWRAGASLPGAWCLLVVLAGGVGGSASGVVGCGFVGNSRKCMLVRTANSAEWRVW